MHHLLHAHASAHAHTCIAYAHTCTVTYFQAFCLCLHALAVIAWCFKFVMLSFKSYYLCFRTNLNLIKFCVLFVFVHLVFFFYFYVQMSPTKHSAPKRPTSKHARTNFDNFKYFEADLKYNDYYKRATIIMERVVKLDTLKDTFKYEVFKERMWIKLLNPVGVVYSEIIKEIFSNASVEGDYIDCWMRHKEFVITRDSIREFLEIRPPSQPIIVQYEDHLDSI